MCTPYTIGGRFKTISIMNGETGYWSAKFTVLLC